MPSPYIRPCMMLFGARYDELSELVLMKLMIASELLTLNTSNVGNTWMRPNRNVRATLKSSWMIRSTNVARSDSRLYVSDGWPKTPVGMMTCPAGHGAGQLVGYRVEPRVTTILRSLVGPALLWNAMLTLMPQPMSLVPAIFQLGRYGMSSANSSQSPRP